MKYGKKILSVFLLVIMVVSIMPMNSLADEYQDEGIYLIDVYGNRYVDLGGTKSLLVKNWSDQQKQYTNENCNWKSSDTSVATVDNSGHVTGKMYGKSTITATTKDGIYSADFEIIVYCSELYIEESAVRLDVGDEYCLKVYCSHLDSITNDGVEGESKIASSVLDDVELFTDEGMKVYTYTITAKSDGDATFSVESYNTGQKCTCQIIVGNPSPTPSPTPTPTPDPIPTPDPTPTPSSDSTTMYRLYNPNSGEHFYTSDVSEKNMLSSIGWAYEGIAWQAPSSGNPVYRMYNPNTGDHHYTTNSSEKDMLVTAGWSYEGVGFYSPNSGVPMLRLYNPNATGAGSHHYTTSDSEKNQLVAIGWKYEGVAWYGV